MKQSDISVLHGCQPRFGSAALDVPLFQNRVETLVCRITMEFRENTNKIVLILCMCDAAHGTNIDGVWVKANNPKQLRIGSKFKFAASSRTYCVRELHVSKK